MSDTCVALRTGHGGRFRFFSKKSVLYISECRNLFFCEAATKTANRKLRTTNRINIRLSEIHMSALISMHKPSNVSFEFCASTCRFHWKQGRFTL
jgi:hypothetical protein